MMQIPCFRTWNAHDVITDDLPIYCGTVGTYGGPGRNFGIQNCDLLLALGCRLSGRITGGVPESFARGAKLYIVDVDAGLLDPKYQPRNGDVNVLADCGEFINAMA
jgi:acetolactate synthase-1/2/3 large subunit